MTFTQALTLTLTPAHCRAGALRARAAGLLRKLLSTHQAKTLNSWRDAVREIHERATGRWHWALRRLLDAPRELVATLAAQTVGVPAALAAA